MKMDYEEALNYIHGALKFGWKLGLHNMKTLLELMGNPHRRLKYVHVAGTNGKGSVTSFICSMLSAAGYRVGMYTSPYLERFTERIMVDNAEISGDDLARITELVREKVEIMVGRGDNHPTEFEIVTAIAFQYYYEMKCDVVVLEVGLGGRFDSTNVIDTPLVSVITTISYDHTDRLGNSLEEIAFEKAGIIKENGDVVIYPQPESVEAVFRNVCAQKNSRLYRVDLSGLRLTGFDIDGQTFDFGEYESLYISLLGEHQTRNAAVALTAVKLLCGKGYNLSEDSIRKGLAGTRWPGRLEVIGRDPLFLIDAAHNAEGARMLANALQCYFPDKRKIFIIGVLKDKDYGSMLETAASIAEWIITVTPRSERALPAGELAILAHDYCKNVVVGDTIESAVKTSLDITSSNDMICAFGSLFYIGEIRTLFGREVFS